MARANQQGRVWGCAALVAALVVACGGESEGGPAACTATACGGDPVGTWTISSVCMDQAQARQAFAMGIGTPACSKAWRLEGDTLIDETSGDISEICVEGNTMHLIDPAASITVTRAG